MKKKRIAAALLALGLGTVTVFSQIPAQPPLHSRYRLPILQLSLPTGLRDGHRHLTSLPRLQS